mmetsp:Transcript_55188/g.109587  ORF Transcript_55188/g.109587 Transcript_55188/m.109587 type:complete len:93 (+) Transcript_55188:319-597(+)
MADDSAAAATAAVPEQTELGFERIRQFPGQVQVDRRVKVDVPGKFFPQLQPSEQAKVYEGEAVEFRALPFPTPFKSLGRRSHWPRNPHHLQE